MSVEGVKCVRLAGRDPFPRNQLFLEHESFFRLRVSTVYVLIDDRGMISTKRRDVFPLRRDSAQPMIKSVELQGV